MAHVEPTMGGDGWSADLEINALCQRSHTWPGLAIASFRGGRSMNVIKRNLAWLLIAQAAARALNARYDLGLPAM